MLSLVVASGGYSLVVVQGLLIAVASLAVEHGLWSVGSIVVLHQLRCWVAREIFLYQESNLCLLYWQKDS